MTQPWSLGSSVKHWEGWKHDSWHFLCTWSSLSFNVTMLDCTQMQQLQKFDNSVLPPWITNHRVKFNIHRSVHCYYICRVQPTWCNVSQFIHVCNTRYTFQTVFPSIIRSSKLHVTYSVRYFSDQYCPARLAAGSSIGLTNTWRCSCSFEILMMDGKTVWNMQSVLQK